MDFVQMKVSACTEARNVCVFFLCVYCIRVTKANGKIKGRKRRIRNREKVGNTNRPLRDKEVRKESMQAESSEKNETKYS